MAVIVAAIAGSLRAGSHGRALLRAAARDLPPGVRLTIWDGLERAPPFSEDLEAGPAPAGAAGLRRLIAGAAAVLIATGAQRVHPGPAEECPRLGIPPAGRGRPGRQADRRSQTGLEFPDGHPVHPRPRRRLP